MRYFEKCVTSGSCLHLTVQKSRLWSYQKVIRLSSLIQSKLLEIIVDYIRGEQLQKTTVTHFEKNVLFASSRALNSCGTEFHNPSTDMTIKCEMVGTSEGSCFPTNKAKKVATNEIFFERDVDDFIQSKAIREIFTIEIFSTIEQSHYAGKPISSGTSARVTGGQSFQRCFDRPKRRNP